MLAALRRVIELPVAASVVWERLWDVSGLARCIPGCGDMLTVEAEKRYRATIRDRVGPFRIAIPLDVRVEDSAPDRLSVTATGRDTALGSPVKVVLVISLESPADGRSRLRVEGQAEIGGRLAALGQALILRKITETLDQFATNLEAWVQQPDAQP
jgi:carbon monoxide dehydrogenase subunit G